MRRSSEGAMAERHARLARNSPGFWIWLCLCAGVLIPSLGRSNARADTGPDAIRCLAMTIYFEARGEPDIGKLAVAHVVVNRTHDTRFPSSTCGVAQQQSGAPNGDC